MMSYSDEDSPKNAMPVPARSDRRLYRKAWLGLAAIVALGLALAAAELASRLAFDNANLSPPVFRMTPDASSYSLLPSIETKVLQFGRVVDVDIDDQANRRVVGAHPNARVRLHVVGDSQIFGWGLAGEETLPSRLQAELGPTFGVINHGVPGYGPKEYLRVLNAIPADDYVLLLHTEENDAADSFGLAKNAGAACGFITSGGTTESPARCFLMSTRLVQVLYVFLNRMDHRIHLTPIGFSNYSQVAGDVLHFRISAGYAKQRTARGSKLIFSIVPWKGRFAPAWQERYAPPPSLNAAALPTPFPDDVGILQAISLDSHRGSFYFEEDPHLSPVGAEHMAHVLAPFIARRVDAASLTN